MLVSFTEFSEVGGACDGGAGSLRLLLGVFRPSPVLGDEIVVVVGVISPVEVVGFESGSE